MTPRMSVAAACRGQSHLLLVSLVPVGSIDVLPLDRWASVCPHNHADSEFSDY